MSPLSRDFTQLLWRPQRDSTPTAVRSPGCFEPPDWKRRRISFRRQRVAPGLVSAQPAADSSFSRRAVAEAVVVSICKRPKRAYNRGPWVAHLAECEQKSTKQAAWDADNLAGLADGLLDASIADLVQRDGQVGRDDLVPVPRWVADGLIAYIRATAPQFKTGKGRHTRWVKKYRQDAVDFERYDTVQHLHLCFFKTLEDAYELASAGLSGLAAGPSSTIEASYKRVAKALKAGEYGRYYRSGSVFMRVSSLDR